MKFFTLAAALLVSSAGQASAQAAATPAEALAPPTGTMICRAVRTDSGRVVVKMVEANDPETPRDMTAAFDSSGTPLALAIFAPAKIAGGRVQTQAYGVRFGPGAPGGRHAVILEPARGDTTTPTTPADPGQPMAEPALSQARDLATWIWDHRCQPPQP